MKILHRSTALLLGALALAACNDDDPLDPQRSFINGTRDNQQIGLVVNSTDKALTLFQLGNPSEQRQIPFGASTVVTPVGLSVRGTRALVPLGNAASVALIDLPAQRITRFFQFPKGNATGSAFVSDTVALVSNLTDDYVGRFTFGQAGGTITDTVSVAPAPGTIIMTGNRALVVSGNLDENFAPLGNGIVTALDPTTLQVLGTVQTGGRNPQGAAIGPDGLLYVVNSEPFGSGIPGSVTIIDPATLQVRGHVSGFGNFPGGITIDDQGIAYISGFNFGTLVWNTKTRTFLRGPDNPVCAKLADNSCRGAFDNAVDENGTLYQTFFGSRSKNLNPYVFVYRAGTFELTDSIAAGAGPTAIEIERF